MNKFNLFSFVSKIYFLFILFDLTTCFNSVTPAWLTSPYFQASRKDVISTLTGNNKTPQYTFTFNSSFPSIPNLAYGISKYQGIDTMGQQYFQVYTISLTASTFSVAVQISGSTSLYLLNVPYLAMDPTFPHHLNSFDNVPLNYSKGLFVNISSKSTARETTYTNVINYTAQCGTRKYNKFSYPLQNQQIVLFMTSLFIQTTWPSGSTIYPVRLKVTATILSNQTYQLQLKVLNNTSITRLHFSQLVFDKVDVQSSGRYVIDSEIWITDKFGGFKQIQQEFTDNFIMGIRQFEASDGICSFQYQWNWISNSTFYGIQILDSITRRGSCGFSSITSTIFYLKSWRCYAPYYYLNITSIKCQDECDFYYIQNTTDYQCIACDHACYICNFSECLSCNALDNRQFINKSCKCLIGYFQYYIQERCRKCDQEIQYCLQCKEKNPYDGNISNLIHLCTLCNQSYFLNQTTGKCDSFVYCNESENSFLNYMNNYCQLCDLEGCLICNYIYTKIINQMQVSIYQIKARNLAQIDDKYVCLTCDNANNYFMNYSNKCELCQLENCLQCASLDGCKVCDQNKSYFLNVISHTCELCSLTGCFLCKSLYQCEICDLQKGYFINNSTNLCVDCSVGCNQCLLSGFITTCSSCLSNYLKVTGRCKCLNGTYLNLTSLQCKPCHSQCKTCYDQNNNACLKCYFQQNRLLQNNTCICNKTNYQQSGVDVCQKINPLLCDMGFFYSSLQNRCLQVCGDSVLIFDQCDDGNNQDKDGCSKICKIQANFSCTNVRYEKSQCFFQGIISIMNSTIYKKTSKNVIFIYGQLSPQLKLYQLLNWKDGMNIAGANVELVDAYMSSQSVLYLQIEYFQNLKGKQLHINFTNIPPNTRLLISSTLNFTFTAYNLNISQTDNKLSPNYYQSRTYQMQQILDAFVFGLKWILLIMVFSVFLFDKYWIFLLNFMMMQTMYLSLSLLNNVHPLTNSLFGFHHLLGFQKGLFFNFQCQGKNLSPQLHLNIWNCFLTNSSLVIQIQLSIVLILTILFFFQKFCNQKFNKYFLQSLRAHNYFCWISFSGVIYSASISNLQAFSMDQIISIIIYLLFFGIQLYFVSKFQEIFKSNMQNKQITQQKKQKKSNNFFKQKLIIKPNEKPFSFFILFLSITFLTIIGLGLFLYFSQYIVQIICIIIILQGFTLITFKVMNPYKDIYLNWSIISSLILKISFWLIILITNIQNDMSMLIQQILAWCLIALFGLQLVNLGLVWSYTLFLNFLDTDWKKIQSTHIDFNGDSSSQSSDKQKDNKVIKIRSNLKSNSLIYIQEESMQNIGD